MLYCVLIFGSIHIHCLIALKRKSYGIIVISECAAAMPNCSQCSAYNICAVCDGDLVVNGTGDGCTGKVNYHKNAESFMTLLIYLI